MKKELPKNWVESSLKNITSYVIGGDWGKDPSKDLGDEFVEVLCIRGSEIKNWNDDKGKTASLRLVKRTSLEKRNLIEGDILIEISGGGPDQPVGRIVYVDKETLEQDKLPKVCTNFLRMLRIHESLNQKFVSLFLEHIYFSGEVINYQGGSNNLRNLKFKDYELIKVPLPPLSEQKRIVIKLDQLFGQLGQIKESVEKIPQLLKDFKQQVLTQAVTGKLTSEWRKENYLKNLNEVINQIYLERKNKASAKQLKKLKDIYDNKDSSINFDIPEEWIEVNLDKVCNSFDYGTSAKSENLGEFPVLRMGNLQNGKLDWNDLKYSNDIKEYEKYKLNIGNVLFNRTNSPELVGKTSVFLGEFEALFAGYLIRIDNRKELNSKFLNYVLNTQYAKEWCWSEKTDGVSQSNINATKLSKFTIPYPSIQEQQEIVTRIESLFAKADVIEQQYKTLKQKIDTLPQAFLHKAFKGELVPQLESDGNARELLEEIKGLKKQVIPKKILKKKKTKVYKTDNESLGMVAEEGNKYKKIAAKEIKPLKNKIAHNNLK